MGNTKKKDGSRGISRRKMMQGFGAGVLVAGSIPELLAKSNVLLRPVPGDEKTEVFRILAFWVAVTNPALPRPTTTAAMAGITGLIQDDVLKKAVDWVNQHSDFYNQINTEFINLERILGYGPGECPKSVDTLKQIAALKPPA
jgi:hypothetical protein